MAVTKQLTNGLTQGMQM